MLSMAELDASAVAELLLEFGRRGALRGGNPYRSRAYARAAESLLAVTEPLSRLVAQDRLREIPGVGEAIADIIGKLHATGTHPALETMRRDVPAGVVDMLSIPGLRPDQVSRLHKELGLDSLEALEEAARADRVSCVKGLGPALQRKILQGIDIRRRGRGMRHIHRAAELLEAAAANLAKSNPALCRIVPAGEFRRGCELVGDLSLVAQVPEPRQGPGIVASPGSLAIHLADAGHYGATLLFATGSQAHLQKLRDRAGERGFILDAQGLRKGNQVIAAASEADIYQALGLPFIEPELRESGDEIGLAAQRKLPRLVSNEDIRGILHAHTDRSDGADTLEAMAEATKQRGYRYFGVADHSKSAHYARGLSEAEIAEQHAEIDRLNAGYRGAFRILKGIESDILADGSLDYEDAVLARFDFVVASVHSRFRLDRKTQTERIIRAVANPHTTILGHMTGRLLLRRAGYDVDVEKILAACAAHGVAVEINANPWRLDLDWRWHQRALELGCMMSINPDAHSIREIDLARWGVAMARKGGVSANRVLNCLDLRELMRHLRERKIAQARVA
jgi:DNA polymerase (family 10)